VKLRDLDGGQFALLRHQAQQFQGTLLHDALREGMETDITRILTTLKSKSTPLDELKYTQGELAQVTRDILSVEGLLRELDREHAKRIKETP
jgi:hypothetical protein